MSKLITNIVLLLISAWLVLYLFGKIKPASAPSAPSSGDGSRGDSPESNSDAQSGQVAGSKLGNTVGGGLVGTFSGMASSLLDAGGAWGEGLATILPSIFQPGPYVNGGGRISEVGYMSAPLDDLISPLPAQLFDVNQDAYSPAGG